MSHRINYNHHTGVSEPYDDNILKHKVYDLSITDIEERKLKAKEFNNANEVAAYLGVRLPTVIRGRVVGRKVKGLNGRKFAIRIVQ